jgi:hypothetical protein
LSLSVVWRQRRHGRVIVAFVVHVRLVPSLPEIDAIIVPMIYTFFREAPISLRRCSFYWLREFVVAGRDLCAAQFINGGTLSAASGPVLLMAGAYGLGEWRSVIGREGWQMDGCRTSRMSEEENSFLAFASSHGLVAIALMHRWIMRDEGQYGIYFRRVSKRNHSLEQIRSLICVWSCFSFAFIFHYLILSILLARVDVKWLCLRTRFSFRDLIYRMKFDFKIEFVRPWRRRWNR